MLAKVNTTSERIRVRMNTLYKNMNLTEQSEFLQDAKNACSKNVKRLNRLNSWFLYTRFNQNYFNLNLQ